MDTFANGLFVLASARGFLSIVSVLGSLYPIATILAAYVFLHERISRTQKAGVGLDARRHRARGVGLNEEVGMQRVLVELIRGGVVDEVHRGDLAIVAADGELRGSVGDPQERSRSGARRRNRSRRCR